MFGMYGSNVSTVHVIQLLSVHSNREEIVGKHTQQPCITRKRGRSKVQLTQILSIVYSTL